MFKWSSLFRRTAKSEFFLLKCPSCGFMKDFELVTPSSVQITPHPEGSAMPEITHALPKLCPECGARLKKQKMFTEIHKQ